MTFLIWQSRNELCMESANPPSCRVDGTRISMVCCKEWWSQRPCKIPISSTTQTMPINVGWDTWQTYNNEKDSKICLQPWFLKNVNAPLNALTFSECGKPQLYMTPLKRGNTDTKQRWGLDSRATNWESKPCMRRPLYRFKPHIIEGWVKNRQSHAF